MFGRLKEKLKSSLSIFSKQVEEEVDDGIVTQETVDTIEEVEQTEEVPESVEVVQTDEVQVDEIQETDEVQESVEDAQTDEVEETIETEKVQETVDHIPETVNENTSEQVVQTEKVEEPVIETIGQNGNIPEQVVQTEEPIVNEPIVQDSVEEQPIVETVQQTDTPKKGFFSRIKESISTKTLSQQKFEDIFWELEIVLLENNVSVKVIDKIKQDLQNVLVDQKLPRNPTEIITNTLRTSVNEILDFNEVSFIDKIDKKPYVIMFFGINGAGKTTTIAKIIKHLQSHDKSVVVAAADTFRAAAIDQIEEHTTKLGVKLIKHDYGSDPAAVAFDAVRHAEKNQIDVVLIDTAGRLHSNTNLMSELDKIKRVANPDLSLFVGESITGNDCVEQAQHFNEVTDLDGVILSKADIDEMGGATLSISYTLQKPIYFLGVGQEYTDLVPFNKQYIIDKLGL